MDYRFPELNAAFERLTVIPAELALSGKTVRELIPDLEEHWVETYGRVALTGGAGGGLPVVALTAYARAEDRVRALRSGSRCTCRSPSRQRSYSL